MDTAQNSVQEPTFAEKRHALRIRVLEALCRRAETPNSLRVICRDQGVNEHFRGPNAAARAAALAAEVDRQSHRGFDIQSWHIQTGAGWTVVTSGNFQRMTKEEIEELLG